MMETRLHKDQLAETTKLFEQLDVDKTGFVRRHEVAQARRLRPISPPTSR